LHRRANAIAIAEIDVIAHPDFIAVVDDRRAGQGKEQSSHQLDLASVVVHQRRESASDAEIEPSAWIGGVGRPQIVAFDVGHHFQRQFVMVAEE
jgi:hypothetical protein